jgi:hypothetical protein
MSYPNASTAVTCYDYEPWHFRYVGRDVAAAIHASGLTPREYLWANFTTVVVPPPPNPNATGAPPAASLVPLPTVLAQTLPPPTASPTPTATAAGPARPTPASSADLGTPAPAVRPTVGVPSAGAGVALVVGLVGLFGIVALAALLTRRRRHYGAGRAAP